MRTKIILLGFVVMSLAACKKSGRIGENEYVTLTYKQTSCADPWINAGTDSLTLINIANYLNSSGLYIASLSIKQDGPPETCLACVCKTGKTIFVSTLNSETMKAKYLLVGFR